MNKKHIIIICLIIYLIIAFVTEKFYRDKLYDFSVEYIDKIEQKGFFYYFYFFWSMIFLYLMMLIGFLLTLFFCPINIHFSFLTIEIILIFIMCILKSFYTNSRPYWDIYVRKQGNSTEPFLPKPTECDGEFGNPSGHALLSTLLLHLWNLFINSNYFNSIKEKNQIIIKYITLILSIISIIFITYSRIHRQIHSFNQILFGTILGIAVFCLFCYIFETNRITSNEFFNKLNKFKFIIIPLLIILFTISVVLGLTQHNEREKEYTIILEIYCEFGKDEIFGKNTAFISTIIFVIIGDYIGLLFLKHKINKYYPQYEDIFYNWNKGKKSQTILIAFISFFIPGLIIMIFFLFLIMPFKYYIFKMISTSLLFFMYGFLSMGVLLYYSVVKLKIKKDLEEKLINNKEDEDEENI